MHKKYTSMMIIAIIYLIATFIGIATFNLLPFENLMINIFLADVIATVFIWIIGLMLKNASLYDPYWSVAPPIIFILVMLHLDANWNTLSILMFLGLLIWSIRLTLNWAKSWVGFQEQDWRYTMIKQKAPKLYLVSNLFGIHLMPTAIVFIQLLTINNVIDIQVSSYPAVFIGFIMMISATFIQYLSDEQMRSFKHRTQGEKMCIEEGLWKYSRHPNYFGEIMVWWGFYVMYVGATMKLDLHLLSPVLMTLLFLFISIPMMEKKILKTRPDYKGYQERVSMIIPFIRKEEDHEMSEES
ncbi:MAG: DUF1295 domain-containing protein [Acholeplasmataceae bacterium]|jgi:steroid 5-alpha reductase family enzyme|nr:DUF1295 domain-containing protein [Acholeplasmataceae bacterium]